MTHNHNNIQYPIIEIDKHSGFCFGVTRAVDIAEKILGNNETLYCLGDIVHNEIELNRLVNLGLQIINYDDLKKIHNEKVLIRAHGEPPETYKTIKKNNIQLIDATCPVVITLQKKIKKDYNKPNKESQIIIFGKPGHAEVVGLKGQTNNSAIIIKDLNDISKIDFNRKIILYSQTTMPLPIFNKIVEKLKVYNLVAHDTICRKVSNRIPILDKFVIDKDIILFVSGEKSSNGKVLFSHCKSIKDNTKFISSIEQIKPEWFINIKNVGICGATSTPKWLLTKVKEKIEEFKSQNLFL